MKKIIQALLVFIGFLIVVSCDVDGTEGGTTEVPEVKTIEDIVEDNKIVVYSSDGSVGEQELITGVEGDVPSGINGANANSVGANLDMTNEIVYVRDQEIEGAWTALYVYLGELTATTPSDLSAFANGSLFFTISGPADSNVTVAIDQGAGAHNGGITANYKIYLDGTTQDIEIPLASMVCGDSGSPENGTEGVTIADGAFDLTQVTSVFKLWNIDTDGTYTIDNIYLSTTGTGNVTGSGPEPEVDPDVEAFASAVNDGKLVVYSNNDVIGDRELFTGVDGDLTSGINVSSGNDAAITFSIDQENTEDDVISIERTGDTTNGWASIYTYFGTDNSKKETDMSAFAAGSIHFTMSGPEGSTVTIAMDEHSGAYSGNGVTANYTITLSETAQEYEIVIAEMVCSENGAPDNDAEGVKVSDDAIDLTKITSPFKVWNINTNGTYVLNDVYITTGVKTLSDVTEDGKLVIYSDDDTIGSREMFTGVGNDLPSGINGNAGDGAAMTFEIDQDGTDEDVISIVRSGSGGWISLYTYFGEDQSKIETDMTSFANGKIYLTMSGPADSTVAVAMDQGAGAWVGGVTASYTITLSETPTEYVINIADMVCSSQAAPDNGTSGVTVADGSIDLTAITSPFKIWNVGENGTYTIDDVYITVD